MAGRQGERQVTHGECHFVDAWQGHAGRYVRAMEQIPYPMNESEAYGIAAGVNA